ncbi:CBS domain-containing protein [Glycomyces buryatensis]|uniref:CBS domain-containing protein n=1 Tax=Glycomyces buryatensis TaxID=2570927 RepID=A0A4S8Q9N0_9ACTN|nr:CBS domain-containing protein [Glycomyces buryatensis]THV41163.1 hypothetical protein FAB82_13005 [Glycomyces buryatensis]
MNATSNPSAPSAKAWLVRSGANLQDEQTMLDEGFVAIRWDRVPDLGHFPYREELDDIVADEYPEEAQSTRRIWVGELWRFGSEIRSEDYIVMPLKYTGDRLMIGQASNGYEYCADAPSGLRHRIRVRWVRDIERDVPRPDLRASLRSLLAVCQLSRNDSATRIAEIAQLGTDPGHPGEPEPAKVDDLLQRAVSAPAETPVSLSIRHLLEHWGFERRTVAAVESVKADLAQFGLTTRPPFTEGSVDRTVDIVPNRTEPDDTAPEVDEDVEDVVEPEPLTRQLGTLPSAVVSVASTESLTYAWTLMAQHGFSQLPVIDGNLYRGTITCQSIADAALRRPGDATISDALVQARVVDFDAELLEVIAVLETNDFILVQNQARSITGIMTAADLAIQFGTLAQPFLLVEEIERRLRQAIDEVFTSSEIRAAFKGNSRIKSASDLSFNGYRILVEDSKRWEQLGWHWDRALFCDNMAKANKIRNEIAHFATDPLTSSQLKILTSLLEQLRRVTPN